MAFRNSILAGEELIRSGIRSPDFTTGVTGWRIARDGSAEFNDVTVRGSLRSVDSITPRETFIDHGIIKLTDAAGVEWSFWANWLQPEGLASTSSALVIFHELTNTACLLVRPLVGGVTVDLNAPRLRVGPGGAIRDHNVLGAWQDITAGCAFPGFSNGTTGTMSIAGLRRGREITLRGMIRPGGAGINIPAGFVINLPANDAGLGDLACSQAAGGDPQTGAASYLNTGVAWYPGSVLIGQTGPRTLDFIHAVPGANAGSVGTNGPAAGWFGAGDKIVFQITYQAATD